MRIRDLGWKKRFGYGIRDKHHGPTKKPAKKSGCLRLDWRCSGWRCRRPRGRIWTRSWTPTWPEPGESSTCRWTSIWQRKNYKQKTKRPFFFGYFVHYRLLGERRSRVVFSLRKWSREIMFFLYIWSRQSISHHSPSVSITYTVLLVGFFVGSFKVWTSSRVPPFFSVLAHCGGSHFF